MGSTHTHLFLYRLLRAAFVIHTISSASTVSNTCKYMHRGNGGTWWKMFLCVGGERWVYSSAFLSLSSPLCIHSHPSSDLLLLHSVLRCIAHAERMSADRQTDTAYAHSFFFLILFLSWSVFSSSTVLHSFLVFFCSIECWLQLQYTCELLLHGENDE